MVGLFSKKAQSTLEYAVIISVVIAALLAMQVYIKRGLQGKLRESTEQIGEQYSPGFTTSEFTTETSSKSKEEVKQGITTSDLDQVQKRTGKEEVKELEKEFLIK